MPERVEHYEPEGIDFGWILQVTFVVTILIGAPIVGFLATFQTLDSWSARATFAIQIGAAIWFLTAIIVYAYARITQ